MEKNYPTRTDPMWCVVAQDKNTSKPKGEMEGFSTKEHKHLGKCIGVADLSLLNRQWL